jgi:hypothetical protein
VSTKTICRMVIAVPHREVVRWMRNQITIGGTANTQRLRFCQALIMKEAYIQHINYKAVCDRL